METTADVNAHKQAGGRFRLENAEPIAPMVAAQTSGASASGISWSRPTPFGGRAVPGFPVEALPGWCSEYVRALALATQTPPDLAAVLALSVVATCAAKRARVELREGWIEPLNLFVAVVLPPASRKSAVFSAIVQPLRARERSEIDRVCPEREAALSAVKLAEKRLERAIARAGRETEGKEAEEIQRLTAERCEIKVPPEPRLITDDCTPERLASLLAEQGGRMALLSPEGGVFEMMAGRYSERGANLEVYLKGHAGDDLRVDRVGRPSDFVPAPALTVGLATQPDVLRSLRDQPRFRGRGLLGRFLYALPRNTVGLRDVNPPAVPPPVAAGYEQRILELLAMTPSTDTAGTPRERLLQLTDGARAAFLGFAAELEPQLGAGGRSGANRRLGRKARRSRWSHCGPPSPGR